MDSTSRMILLDTNVISELLRPGPDAHVMRWLAHVADNDLVTATPVVSELLAGVTCLRTR